MAIAMNMENEAMVSKNNPPMEKRRVVVTGMGVETSLGYDPHTFYENLLQGNSGISHIEDFDCSNFPTAISKYYYYIKTFLVSLWSFFIYYLSFVFKFCSRESRVRSNLSQLKDGLLLNCLGGWTSSCSIFSLLARKLWLMVV